MGHMNKQPRILAAWIAFALASGRVLTAAEEGSIESRWAALFGDASSLTAPSDSEMGAHLTKHFRLLHRTGATGIDSLGGILESMFDSHAAACRAAGFALRTPAEPLDWLCLQGEQEALSSPRGASRYAEAGEASFYSSQADCVVILPHVQDAKAGDDKESSLWPSMWCLSHELGHQMAYHTGIQSRGVLYAFWVSEGLAANLESPSATAVEFCGNNPCRQRLLIAAHRAGRLTPLNDVLTVTESPKDEEARTDLYAQSWGMVRFLFQRNPSAFRRYLATLAMRPRGRRPDAALRQEFTQTFGTLEAVNSEWLAFLERLASENEASGTLR